MYYTSRDLQSRYHQFYSIKDKLFRYCLNKSKMFNILIDMLDTYN